jgi:hypothetical protein
MNNFYNTFYHLQIAKCGGTYLNNMVVHQLFTILKNNNKNYIDGEYHLGWQEVDNLYTMSCFRDPVKRTVSHYAYYKNGGQNGPIPIGVPSFIDWVKQNEQILSNYQCKNFIYTKKNLHLNPFNPDGIDPDFLNISIDKDIINQRLSKTNLLLKNSQLNYNTCISVMDKILSEFSIKFKFFIDGEKQYDHNVTDGAKEIFNNLKSTEIKYIYEINNLDSEIYFTDSLYFNEGK